MNSRANPRANSASIAAAFRWMRLLSLFVLASMALSFALAPFAAHAAVISPPVIAIQAQDALLAQLDGGPVFSWSTSVGRPLQVVATISRADLSAVDVYLGVLVPGGRIYSWVPGPSAPVLVAGLSPAARGITAY